VEDYRKTSRTNTSSRRIFDSSAYSTPDSALQLHTRLLDIFKSAANSETTPFENFMERLAERSNIQRHYTQNIDCRSIRTNLPTLSQITTCLHGRLDRMMCHRYSQHLVNVTLDTFSDRVGASCPTCQKEDSERMANGKRSHGMGFLRPKVLLYGEDCPDEEKIIQEFKSDIRGPVDVVLIVGTRLQIPSLKDFVLRLCRQVRRRKGITVWINKENPKLGLSIESLLDFQFIGDCDEFASAFI
jgi:NAD-dependent SIR2 family protein deacetylase